ncbi:bifunctional riboflavin kinase/FAD synthetase [Clostridium oryzae]|uniref:Riboflavin biosynthesis protein n=1 Tax=Clostridium oryzae TaxID=1450648 RepID=A0A1V4IPU6_9CLOT|nr:bifunctional riboflavin kinase/FAD synthetase [Clostridium oryzae]OPJ61815.1 riboflavin biosynthesis protein RibF [Clostridium oryzae]
MLIIKDSDKKIEGRTFIALGSFDGLHRGHRKLIDKCIELSKEHKVRSMVYTFQNHPLTIVRPEAVPKLLMDNDTKIEMLDNLGVDIVAMENFTRQFMQLSAEEFVLRLLERFSPLGLVAGFNHRFGYKNSGDVNFLKLLGEKYNFSVTIITPQNDESDVVSSSRIRKLIEEGHIETANELLLSNFMLQGTVVYGKQIGKTVLGYPTANIKADDRFVIPKRGVYYTIAEVNGKKYKAMTNVGINPSVKHDESIKIESHLLDFDEDIYGRHIKIYFMERIRDEVKFSSVDKLMERMNKDYELVKNKRL